MIKHLLQERLPVEYGMNPQDIRIPIHTENTPFSISDRKSCTECHNTKHRVDRTDCNESILYIDNNGHKVTIVEFEKYISQYKANMKDRCDYILLDDNEEHRKIAFCDLTCSQRQWMERNSGKYPEGKRAKAINQMLSSIEFLITEPLLGVFILTFKDRVCLLGWREYSGPQSPEMAIHGNALQNMRAFSSTPSDMARQTTSRQYIVGHEFKFVQVKYPHHYQW